MNLWYELVFLEYVCNSPFQYLFPSQLFVKIQLHIGLLMKMGAALSALAPLFGTFWGNTDLIPFLLPSPQELGSKSRWPGFRLAKAVGSPA